MAGFRSRQPELQALGVGLFFIGSGNAAMAADFRQELGLDVPVLVDPRRETYRYLGFKRQLSMLLDPRVWLNSARAARAGFKQQRTAGDPWQQGGVLVVHRGGEVAWSFASALAGDHPPVEEVLTHARRVSLNAR